MIASFIIILIIIILFQAKKIRELNREILIKDVALNKIKDLITEKEIDQILSDICKSISKGEI